MTKKEIIEKLRGMAKFPTVTLPRDSEALRKAADLLEEQDQGEPVAWISHNAGLYHFKPDESLEPLPLYLAPPQRTWVGLTDEEIEKGRDQTFSINNPYCPCDSKTMRKAVRWAEAKLKEKNT